MSHLALTRWCQTSSMATESTRLPTRVAGSIEEGPVDTGLHVVAADTFDVEPPYTPGEEALAAVEKYADRFLDREVSWLHFNQRVLELAEDASLPLLERVRFLAIFASNLDEFFMVRVAGLKRRMAAGVAVRSVSGQLPREVLKSIWANARELMDRHASVFRNDIIPELGKEGIEVVRWDDLDRDEQKQCKRLFRDRVFPVLTPLAVDPAHPFPYISGLSLNLAVLVRNPKTGKEHFARVKVPPIFHRFVPLGNQRFVPLEDVIGEHLKRLFPGMEVLQVHTFRVTRNEDLEVEEDDAENLLAALEKELLRRKFGPPVRLEVEESIDPTVLELLISELGVSEDEVFRLPGPLDLRGLHDIADLDRQDLQYDAFLPSTHPLLAPVESASPVDVFKALKRADVLLHHPYDSFSTSVQRFIEQAAADPHVLAIKQTLYRTSGDSPIIDALVDAAEAGKQVLVLVEIKARFDESNNIRWARQLEHAGCHVVYGMVGLKTHCKLAMVVRDDALIIIADHTDVRRLPAGQAGNEFELQAIGILKFINQQLPCVQLPFGADFREFRQEADRLSEQIVKVHRVESAKFLFIAVKYCTDESLLVVARRPTIVLRFANEVLCQLHVELLIASANASDDLLDQTQLVAFVEDTEIRFVTEALCIGAKDSQAERMESRGGNKLGLFGLDHLGNSLLHFTRRLVGEGHGAYFRRILALSDQPGDSRRDGPRLARPRARKNQQRTFLMLDRLYLRGVQIKDAEPAHGNSPRVNLPMTSG